MINTHYKKNAFIIPLLIAICVFFYVCGPRCLNPSNIAWLFDGDSAQHYLGWAFFRNSPWSFPLGLNPDWGLENSSSIIYADALPVFSIFFKCLNFLLPEVFQFYGLWFLTCFILQACFSWRLLSIFKLGTTLKFFGTFFFTFCPVIFMRLGGHQSLTAHFLILWCFCLYYANLEKKNAVEWMICLSLTVACHPYFSVMCLSVFGAFICKEFFKKRDVQNISNLFLLIILCLVSIVLTAWQIGLFVGTAAPSSDTEYGFYKFNLNGFLNPLGSSFFLRTQAHGGGDYEGFAYLGVGLLFLIFFIVVLDSVNSFRQTKIFIKKSLPLCIFLFFLLLLAISNNISFGNWQLKLYSVKAGSFLQTFRSTGRFIWPVWYFLILYAFVLLQKALNNHLISYKVTVIMLTSFMLFQLVDFHEFIHDNVRKVLMNNNSLQWGDQSKDWDFLRKKYSQIRLLNNPGLGYHKWRELSLIAANHRFKTNVFYLARSDSKILSERKKLDESLLKSGNFDQKTIYVLSDEDVNKIKQEVTTSQLIIKLDGFNLLLPIGL